MTKRASANKTTTTAKGGTKAKAKKAATPKVVAAKTVKTAQEIVESTKIESIVEVKASPNDSLVSVPSMEVEVKDRKILNPYTNREVSERFFSETLEQSKVSKSLRDLINDGYITVTDKWNGGKIFNK